MSLVVAYYMPHNDGIESGILDAPGQNTGTDLVDLYEVDGVIATFATRDEAQAWLDQQGEADTACIRCGVTKFDTKSPNHVVADECVDGHLWSDESDLDDDEGGGDD